MTRLFYTIEGKLYFDLTAFYAMARSSGIEVKGIDIDKQLIEI